MRVKMNALDLAIPCAVLSTEIQRWTDGERLTAKIHFVHLRKKLSFIVDNRALFEFMSVNLNKPVWVWFKLGIIVGCDVQ